MENVARLEQHALADQTAPPIILSDAFSLASSLSAGKIDYLQMRSHRGRDFEARGATPE